jgi:hypothetical protein
MLAAGVDGRYRLPVKGERFMTKWQLLGLAVALMLFAIAGAKILESMLD